MKKLFSLLTLGLFLSAAFSMNLPAQNSQNAPLQSKPHHKALPKSSNKKNKKKLKKKAKKHKASSGVFIPKDSAHWKPISVFKEKKKKFKSALFIRQIQNVVEKIKNKKTKKVTLKKVLKGEESSAKVLAALYGNPVKGELIISLFPKSLKELRKHLELRFFISQKRLIKVQPVIVSILDKNQAEKFLDSHQLDRQKISFGENYASSGKIYIAGLDIRPGKKTFNSARLEMAAFGEDAILGDVSAEFSLRGLLSPRK